MKLAAQDRSNARSMVITRYGIVATSYAQASVAGAQILAKGGSAIDAAIAANATLGVTEPMMNGMGGDLFAIYWDAKTGKLYGLNSSGWAPQALTLDHVKAKGATNSPEGIDSSHCSRRRRRMERAPQKVRTPRLARPLPIRHLLRRSRISRRRNRSGLLDRGSRVVCPRPRRPARLPAQRQSPRAGTGFPES